MHVGYCGYIPHVYPGNLFGKTYGVITSIAGMKSRDTGSYFLSIQSFISIKKSTKMSTMKAVLPKISESIPNQILFIWTPCSRKEPESFKRYF